MTAEEQKLAKLERLWAKNKNLVSPEDRQLLKAKWLREKAEVDAKAAEVKKANPFWFYMPVTGEIAEDRMEFLKRYIRKEDIPQKLSGSLDIHMSDAPIRGASGGNQGGKTTSAIIEALMKASGKVPFCFDPESEFFKWKLPEKRYKWTEPQYVRIVSVDYQNGILKNLIPSFQKWTPKEFLKNGEWTDSYSAEKQILSIYWQGQLRGFIEFMSNKQDLASFQGPPRHMLIFDEEPDHDIYKENLLRLTTAESFEVFFAMTPTNGLSWVWDDIVCKGQDASGHNVEWLKIPSVCNPHANLKVLNEIMSEIPVYEERKMRLLGEFVSLSGLVYGRLFQKNVHVIDPFETGCDCGGAGSAHAGTCPYTNYLGYLGIDAHMVKPSCAVLAFIDSEDNFYVDTCYKASVDTDQFKKDLTNLTANRRMDWAVFDPSNDSNITIHKGVNIFKLCTTGENRIKRAFKGDKYQGSIAAGVDTIKKRLKIEPRTNKPTFFIMNRPENQELIKSMISLQRDSNLNEEVKGKPDKIREGVHDHHAAMRYILQNRLVWKDLVPSIPVSDFSDREALLL